MATFDMASTQKRRSDCRKESDDEADDYVTLAKAGGRKGLLQHVEYVRASEEPEEYPVVEWFAHPTPPPPDPEKEPYRSPLDKSWMTWTIPDHLPRLGPSQTTAPAARSRHSHPPPSHTKLPPLLDERVEFDRLLSMDYQKEWLIERKAKEEQVLRKAKEKRRARRQKMLEHTMKARRVAGVTENSSSSKSRFIMKRFATVPAKLKLPNL